MIGRRKGILWSALFEIDPNSSPSILHHRDFTLPSIRNDSPSLRVSRSLYGELSSASILLIPLWPLHRREKKVLFLKVSIIRRHLYLFPSFIPISDLSCPHSKAQDFSKLKRAPPRTSQSSMKAKGKLSRRPMIHACQSSKTELRCEPR